MGKIPPATIIVTCNDLDDVKDELEEWDCSASLDVMKVLKPAQLDDAKKSADASAKGSNVDFVVYEVREIYRAKRGF